MTQNEELSALADSQEGQVAGEEDKRVETSSLLDCLLLVAELEGKPSSEPAIVSGLPLRDGNLTPEIFVRAANRAGLAGRILQRKLADIPKNVLPAILQLRDDAYTVLTDIDIDLGYAVIRSGRKGEDRQVELSELATIYDGFVYYTRPMQMFDRRTPKIYQNPQEHWFWGVIKSSTSIYRDVLIASFFINLFVLAQPLFVMNVYDRVVPNNAVETLWALAIGVVIVYGFDLLLKTLRSYFVELAAKRSDVILSSILFERVLGIKMENRPVSVGAFVNRLQEFDSIRNFITSSSLLALIDLPFLILFLLFIAYIGGWLVLVPVAAIPVALFMGYSTQRRLRPIIQNVMTGGAKKSAALVENLSGVETIKTLGAESRMQKSWEQAVGYVSQWSLESRKLSNRTLFSVQSLQQFSMVAIVVWGVYLIADQSLTLGGLIACVILNGRALAPLSQVASLITHYDHAEATLKSLNEIMASPTEREPGKRYLHRPELKGDIQYKNVTFAYGDQAPALDGISISIKAGEKVGIIGRIGSGKTTLGKLLLRLYEPQQGAVLVDGFDTSQIDPADLRGNIGYLSQDVTLFFGTLRENITLGRQPVHDEDIVKAAEQAGIADLVNSHPLGFDMPIGERGETLSGGQRHAIALARVFLRDPPILLLDEPTASMDQGTEIRATRQLRDFGKDKTLLLITHKMSMLELVDRLVILDKGKIVADGPKEKVIEALKNGQVKGRI
ncbi:MAG: type I secretion system permease/ATPase [Porticoccaceae bacterium]|nr:type I secretion system permease/ATPase [Porticoccaceae bacterium]